MAIRLAVLNAGEEAADGKLGRSRRHPFGCPKLRLHRLAEQHSEVGQPRRHAACGAALPTLAEEVAVQPLLQLGTRTELPWLVRLHSGRLLGRHPVAELAVVAEPAVQRSEVIAVDDV